MHDSQLVSRFLAGDLEALGVIYDRYSLPVYRYLSRLVGTTDAEDVLQETFIRAANRLKAYREQERLLQWLLTVARNVALDRLRKKTYLRKRFRKYWRHREAERKSVLPEAQQHTQETKEKIDQALSKLPETQRSVFLLREEAQLKFREVAEIMDIPLGTALSYMRRATENLRKELKGQQL